MPRPDRSKALDHVVVIMFENRSFDNLLGRLYEPGEVASFEGVSCTAGSASRTRAGCRLWAASTAGGSILS